MGNLTMRELSTKRTMAIGLISGVALLLGGCPGQTVVDGASRNAFQSLAENFGSTRLSDEDRGGGVITDADTIFRQPLTLDLANFEWQGDLEVQFIAWIDPSSIRSREQEDILIRGGYTELAQTLQIGSVYTLPPGTFVYNAVPRGQTVSFTPNGIHRLFIPRALALVDVGGEGGGEAGGEGEDASGIRGRPQARLEFDQLEANRLEFSLITPDVVLLFYDPPVSCESVAFRFLDSGGPVQPDDNTGLTFAGATLGGFLASFKTLQQVQGYSCAPFRPGFFFRRGGGVSSNEFLEGQTITVSFTSHGFVNREEFALVEIR